MDTEEEEQRRRAAELREQVERLKSGEEAPAEEEEGAEPVPESPREFIRRKMREEEEQGELDEEEPAGED